MFRRIFEALISTRQEKANREIARYLQREYPGESIEYIREKIIRGDNA